MEENHQESRQRAKTGNFTAPTGRPSDAHYSEEHSRSSTSSHQTDIRKPQMLGIVTKNLRDPQRSSTALSIIIEEFTSHMIKFLLA